MNMKMSPREQKAWEALAAFAANMGENALYEMCAYLQRQIALQKLGITE